MADLPRLLYGPYHSPTVTPGDWLDDEIAGRVQVGGYTTAPIPWPRRKKTGTHSPILFGDLARAVRLESSEAVQHWWDVGAVTVWKWRQALGVERVTDGTRELLRERTGVPADAAARGREKAAAPESRAKMAESKRGKPMPPETRSALLAAARRKKPAGWGVRANAWMLGRTLPSPEHNGRYTEEELDIMRHEYPRRSAAAIAAMLGRTTRSVEQTAWQKGLRRDVRWTPEMDAVLIASSMVSVREIARQLGRTVGAVYCRRHVLGLMRKR